MTPLSRFLAPLSVLLFALAGNAQPMKPAPGGKKPATTATTATTSKGANTPAITVANVTIRKNQIDTLADMMARARGASLKELPVEQSLRLKRAVANQLIGQELIELEARARGIQATPREIDSAVKELKSRFPDAASWQRAMRNSGDSEAEVRNKIARQIRSEKLLTSSITPPAAPTEAEMRALWNEKRKDFPINDSLGAVQILLLADGKTSGEASNSKRRRLEVLRGELLEDTANTALLTQKFMQLAARNGEGPEARIGGYLERFHPDDFNADFKTQVLKLRVGQMSPVFRTPLGWHLILLVEKYDGKYDSYRLQTLQYLTAVKKSRLEDDMREFLKKLAGKYPVKFLQATYRDNSEGAIY
jgi:parvulin-like peptidyl-prolyl isomerase